MDQTVAANQKAWDDASLKHDREYEQLLEQARAADGLTADELRLMGPVLVGSPHVVHLQSGHGIDDPALVAAGAASVVGVDFSAVAVGSAQRRAQELGLPCRYLLAEVPPAPLAAGCADLVYTGKGALIWMRDLDAWAGEVRRLLRPGGTLFVYEAHPAVPLWSWDSDRVRVRPDRSYFAATNVNDTFPARGAVEWQRTLGQVVTTVVRAGLVLDSVEEYAEPFWRDESFDAAAWRGQVPNAFSLLAHRP